MSTFLLSAWLAHPSLLRHLTEPRLLSLGLKLVDLVTLAILFAAIVGLTAWLATHSK